MSNIIEDTFKMAEWIVECFSTLNYSLDYSIESVKYIDQFFDDNVINGKVKEGGPLSENIGSISFGIGSYIGNLIIKNRPGAFWEEDENTPDDEYNLKIVLPDDFIIYPNRVIVNRIRNIEEKDSIYEFVKLFSELK